MGEDFSSANFDLWGGDARSIFDFDQLSLNCNQQKEPHQGKGIMVWRWFETKFTGKKTYFYYSLAYGLQYRFQQHWKKGFSVSFFVLNCQIVAFVMNSAFFCSWFSEHKTFNSNSNIDLFLFHGLLFWSRTNFYSFSSTFIVALSHKVGAKRHSGCT